MKQSMLMVAALSSVASADEFVGDDMQLSLLQVSAKPHKTRITAEQAPMEYIGCFVDDGARDLNQGPKNYGYNSESCKQACQSFTYFALQANGWCVCDNQYSKAPQYRAVGDNECGGVCAGEAGSEPPRYCGAGWRNAVYAVADATTTTTTTTTEEPEIVEDDVAAAEGDPHISHGGIHEDLCCDGEGKNRVCKPCSQDLYAVMGMGKMGMGMGKMGSGKMGSGKMGMGKMGMGKMGMGKMGMGKMGMGMGDDEAEAVGDPHITSLTGEKADLCCEGGVCKAC